MLLCNVLKNHSVVISNVVITWKYDEQNFEPRSDVDVKACDHSSANAALTTHTDTVFQGLTLRHCGC